MGGIFRIAEAGTAASPSVGGGSSVLGLNRRSRSDMLFMAVLLRIRRNPLGDALPVRLRLDDRRRSFSRLWSVPGAGGGLFDASSSLQER